MKKKIIWGVVIIAVIIITGVCYSISKPKDDHILVESTDLINKYANTTPTSDWKTYANTKYGFEIKYPSTWGLKSVNEGPIPNQKRVSFMFNTPGNLIGFTIVANTKEELAPYHGVGTKLGENNDYVFSSRLPDGYVIPDELKSEYLTLLSTFKFTSPTPTINPNMSGGKYPEMVVVYPNGGEKILYGNIVMAGDLGFRWKTSLGTNYQPTPEFAAFLIDENNKVVRSDFVRKTNPVGNGVFTTSFVGEANIQINKNYKIRVCDEVDQRIVKCDESDNYFTITN